MRDQMLCAATILWTGCAAEPATTKLVAADDQLAVEMNTPAQLDVLGNDLGVTSPVTLAIATMPAHGTATLAADGTLSYQPATDYLGDDTVGYSITDARGATSIAAVAVTVGCMTCAMNVPITLTWDPNAPSEMVQGYRVYFGHANDPAMLAQVDDLAIGAPGFDANAPQVAYDAWQKFRLRIGDTACFALTAYNSAGESGFSNIACLAVEKKAMHVGL